MDSQISKEGEGEGGSGDGGGRSGVRWGEEEKGTGRQMVHWFHSYYSKSG